MSHLAAAAELSCYQNSLIIKHHCQSLSMLEILQCVYSQSDGAKNMVPADKAGICLMKQVTKKHAV